MSRLARIATTLCAICAAATICISASATAAVPKGTLSSTEYRQLSKAAAALKQAGGSKSLNWKHVLAACRKTGGSTALLRTQRASCLASVVALEALASFPAEQERCASTSTGTTTTPTTTTPTATTTPTTTTPTTTGPSDSVVIEDLVCMDPRYAALARDARTIYRDDVAARKQAVARGFTGKCLAVLVSTPADLTKEKRFATSTTKLSADVTLLVKVTEGKAPASDVNVTQIDRDVTQFEKAASAVLGETGAQNLSVCPHQ